MWMVEGEHVLPMVREYELFGIEVWTYYLWDDWYILSVGQPLVSEER